MKAIGGYFELELNKGGHYHPDAIRLNSARNCFEYILLARKYKKVYIPYYTCEVMLEPLRRQDVSYEFYHIDESLEPAKNRSLHSDEAFLYTNYFGLKQDCVKRLASLYGTQLIVDNAQAFFAERVEHIDTFYSPRKFFGVPDGGYLYTDCTLMREFPIDISLDRMPYLVQRIDCGAEYGYKSFIKAEESLNKQPIKRMSQLSNSILENIDYRNVKKKRYDNFKYINEMLGGTNRFIWRIDADDIPMAYPYLIYDDHIKDTLISNKIYVATYWPNVQSWSDSNDWEYRLAKYLVALPVDQRYDNHDLSYPINQIKKCVV